MTYAAPFLRLAVIGTGYGDETWTWTLSLIDGGGPAEPSPDEVPVEIINAVRTFHTSPLISSAAKLTTIKLNLIGTDGRYVNEDDTILHDFTTPVAGGHSGFGHAHNSIAVTLDTESRRGYASKGRFYPPYVVANPEASGYLPLSQIQTYADAAATMLNGINANPFGWVVGVTSAVGSGAQRRVQSVRVGRVMDVQRRRKNRLLEQHVDATVPVTT